MSEVLGCKVVILGASLPGEAGRHSACYRAIWEVCPEGEDGICSPVSEESLSFPGDIARLAPLIALWLAPKSRKRCCKRLPFLLSIGWVTGICPLVSLRCGVWRFCPRQRSGLIIVLERGHYDLCILFLVKYWTAPIGRLRRRKTGHASSSQTETSWMTEWSG